MYINDDLERLVSTLHGGGLIIYPTDTIWGIGCDATNPEAVKKVYDLKERSKEKSLIILVNSIEMLEEYVFPIPPKAYQILEFHKRPLTMIYASAKGIASNALAKNGSLGARVCLEKYCQEIIAKFGKPIISTSANFSGEESPKNFQSINMDLLAKVDYVSKHKQTETIEAQPSQIAYISDENELIFIRNSS